MPRVHGLLGSHVIDGAHDLAGSRQRIPLGIEAAECRQPHVEDLDGATRVHEEIARLDVTMDDSLLVRERQPTRRLNHPLDGVLHRLRARFPHDFGEIPAAHVLHDEVVQAGDLPRIESRDDVGVIESRCRLHLARETADGGGALQYRRSDDLERNDPSHRAVLRLVHDTHASSAKQVEDDVGPEDEGRCTAITERTGLEGCQPPRRDESLCERRRVASGLDPAKEVLQRAGREDAAVFRGLHEVGDGGGHGRASDGIVWRRIPMTREGRSTRRSSRLARLRSPRRVPSAAIRVPAASG